MKLARNVWWSVCFYVLATGQAFALSDDDVGQIYRWPSMQGLTGLLTMNTADTLGTGGFALSVYGLAESGSIPADYSTVQIPAALLIGFSQNIEIGVRAKSVTATGGGRVGRENGLGDSELLAKWKFRNANENLPTMALGFGLLFPTGDADKGFAEAENWGGKFMVMASSETAVLENSFLGLYGEGQVVVRDRYFGGTTAFSDTYGVVNVGLTFPISDDNQLLFTLEYNRVSGRINLTLGESDNILTPSLRYTTKYLNFAVGVQFLDDSIQEDGRRERVIATLGLGF